MTEFQGLFSLVSRLLAEVLSHPLIRKLLHLTCQKVSLGNIPVPSVHLLECEK